ncbi:MAG: hypothetical protein AAGA70_14590 [Pseudomonadota bacterium]
MSILSTIRTMQNRRSAYRKTVFEIEAMPLNTAIDLGLFREDAHKIARAAVYGG